MMKKRSKGVTLDYLSDYYDILTPAERSRFRRKQIGLVAPGMGEKLLEVGCGTGVLSRLAKLAVGETGTVEGIDLDPKMIANAKKKADKSSLSINFRIASVDELPYSEGSFDIVISSLMFHHLPIEVKKRALDEIYRVLKEGGKFFLFDFCSPHPLTIPIMYLLLIWTSATRYQLLGKLPGLIRKSSFKNFTLLDKGLFLEYYLMTKVTSP